jgi:outer membrane cobalamin receptor
MKKYLLTALVLASSFTNAEETPAHRLETVEVIGREINLLGDAVSASEGIVGQAELNLRPILRTGEILELVPGMVVTQHSGTGKANQYFLRGFNLDHGTDFATHVDGMPVNMRTHGHGQGYTDLNFIIPETLAQLAYKKGAYYSDIGDFSGAGGASITTANKVEKGSVELNLGQDGYYRLLFIDSYQSAQGDTLLALEANQYDGPWTDIDENLNKKNVLLKHTKPLDEGFISVSLMGYDNQWNSADQIPARAVSQGLIDELGSLDTTVGGESSRYSLNTLWQHGTWQGEAYVMQYDLALWSNFTYFLDDPVNGDQFEQVDQRLIYGINANRTWNVGKGIHKAGVQLRVDDIDEVGLYRTKARQRLGAIRSDQVQESSLGIYWENRRALTENLRAVVGLRHDLYDFSVKNRVPVNYYGNNLQANSGKNSDSITSLKGNLIYTINDEWETYISAGQGFHSNDARGTTINIDPIDGSAVSAVDPLVRSLGYEAGIRGFINDRLNTSISLWHLDLDSELLFVGDAGTTEQSRESQRQGLELTAYYHFSDEWNVDLEYAHTDAKFSDPSADGNRIPGAVKHVLQAGLNAQLSSGWFGSLRLRYFGERPLVENGSVTSDSSAIWSLRAGYETSTWSIKADVLNLTDSNDRDIDYYYASRLAGEPAGSEIDDVHYHVIEPRTLRVSVSYSL